MLKVGEDSPAGCGSAQESSANGAYALSDAQAMTRGVRDAECDVRCWMMLVFRTAGGAGVG